MDPTDQEITKVREELVQTRQELEHCRARVKELEQYIRDNRLVVPLGTFEVKD